MEIKEEFEVRASALIASLSIDGLPWQIVADRDYVLGEIDKMVRRVREGKLPPREQRRPELTRLVSDQWPPHALGNEVAVVEAIYRKI